MADIVEIPAECGNAVDATAAHNSSPLKATVCDSVGHDADSKTTETTETCTKAHEDESTAADTTEHTSPKTVSKRKSEDLLGHEADDVKKTKTDEEEKKEETEDEMPSLEAQTEDVSNGKSEHTDDVESTNGKEATEDVIEPEIVTKTVEDVAKLSEEVDS